jgi:hypothetical protein
MTSNGNRKQKRENRKRVPVWLRIGHDRMWFTVPPSTTDIIDELKEKISKDLVLALQIEIEG